MKGRLFLVGMLALALTFGLVLVGCDKDDDGGGGANSDQEKLQGTWYYRYDGQIWESYTFSGSNYTYKQTTNSGLVIYNQGAYSVSGGVIVFRYTKIRNDESGAMVDADGYYTYSYSLEGSSLILDGYTYNK